MSVALRVSDVSKQYRIYERPGDRLTESLTRGRLKRHREFWALSEVSFEVGRGETVGIVGPNGCGKSTLLQIVAGTLEPTHGSVETEGRVAALLELGAGFDPEFTGAENALMNAALLGLSRREAERLLPEIERFAEVGAFFRQPVKTYSSGMYVRLAFAIAASVEPDILVIDEALAVGDAVFQHRCLRRIKEFQERGATVLLVSHDAAAVRALCTRAVLLSAGRLLTDGRPSEVLNRYQKIVMEREEAFEATRPAHADDGDGGEAGEDDARDESRAPLSYTYRHGDGSAEVVSAELLDAARRAARVVESGESLTARVRVRFHAEVEEPVVGFLVRNRHGIHAYGTNTKEQGVPSGRFAPGEGVEVSFSFDCWLGIDDYSISFAVHSREGVAYDWLDGVLFFRVTSAVLVEGVANLNATTTARRIQQRIAGGGWRTSETGEGVTGRRGDI